MTNDQDYTAQIQAELDRLDHLSSRRWQRDRTILALAAAAVDGRSFNETFGRDGVVGKPTYYSRGADWYANSDFRDVLTAVTELKRRQNAAARDEADEAARRKRHEKRAELLETAVSKLETLLSSMETDKQTPTAVATYLRAVLAEERAEFGETEALTVAVVDEGAAKIEEVRASMLAKLTKLQQNNRTMPEADPETGQTLD